MPTPAEKLKTCVAFDQAQRAARAMPHIDINASVIPCPASQRELFVVPVRYARSEIEADHKCCVPGVTTESRPMAARRLRGGFLYVWHKEGPLKRYAISATGRLAIQDLADDDTVITDANLTGLALDKHHNAWMMYTEYPLSLEHCQALSDSPDSRNEHMRHIALRTVADELQAPHCPPLTAANQVIAELIPQSYAQALNSDKRQGNVKDTDGLGTVALKKPNKANIDAYLQAMHQHIRRENAIAEHPNVSDEPVGQWSADAWDAQGTQDWLEQAVDQAGGLFSVLACLNDDAGVLRDINHEQETVEAEHEQWTIDNNLRLTIGGFVHSLVTEDGAELAGHLNYRYKDRELAFTPEQGQTMLDDQAKLFELLEQEKRAGSYDGHPTAGETALRNARIDKILGPTRALIPEDLYADVEGVLRQYRAEKKGNLESGAFSAKVNEHIDLEAMNHWLEVTAPSHFERVEQRHNALYVDRGVYLKRSVKALWFVDYVDISARVWLTDLGNGCLSGQCIRAEGAEQFANFVRAGGGSPLAQVFNAWTPSIGTAVASISRLSELLAALESENIDATRQALASLTNPILDDLANIGKDPHAPWALLVNRLSSSLLLLKGDKGFSAAWMGIFITARLGAGARLSSVHEGGQPIWQLLGPQAEGLNQWVKDTGRAIGAGKVEGIVDSRSVATSAGVLPLAALLLNTLNAVRYLEQAGPLEGMDDQRWNDTVSASLYASAALVGVIDHRVRVGMGIAQIGKGLGALPTLVMFGGLVGGLSFGGALKEFQSLQLQMARAQTKVDPWLKMRRNIVGGQIATYGAQGLAGAVLVARVLIGLTGTGAAAAQFALIMGPLSFVLLGLGALYLLALYFEQTPLQNFLSNCCWSKKRANNQAPIEVQAQQDELRQLYEILYTPKVSIRSHSQAITSNGIPDIHASGEVTFLSIDLPGAQPGDAQLQLQMIGNPVDAAQHVALLNKSWFRPSKAPRPWRDMSDYWLPHAKCEWIPFPEGQGLRLSGPFTTYSDHLGSLPGTVSLRLRYHTPLLAMMDERYFVAGQKGVAFTLSHESGVVVLRDDPTPLLNSATTFIMGRNQPGENILQPKERA